MRVAGGKKSGSTSSSSFSFGNGEMSDNGSESFKPNKQHEEGSKGGGGDELFLP